MRGDCKVNVSFCLDREDFTSNATRHRSEADLRGISI